MDQNMIGIPVLTPEGFELSGCDALFYCERMNGKWFYEVEFVDGSAHKHVIPVVGISDEMMRQSVLDGSKMTIPANLVFGDKTTFNYYVAHCIVQAAGGKLHLDRKVEGRDGLIGLSLRFPGGKALSGLVGEKAARSWIAD